MSGIENAAAHGQVAWPGTDRLQASTKGNVLRIVKGAGHMAHHFAACEVAETIETADAVSREDVARRAAALRAA